MKEIKKFFKNFLVLIIFTAIALAIFLIARARAVARINEQNANYYPSPNTERVYGDRRVFDYADQLTDYQEAELTAYIHEAEKLTQTDIVIVTLCESLADYEPEYRAGYDIEVTPDKYVMVYADKFWEDNRFGYNCPQKLDGRTDTGDGVILVDNLFREPETGKMHTWMGTTGSVEEKFSSSMIDAVLDAFYEQIDDYYYGACKDFVDAYVDRMVDSPLNPPTLKNHFGAYLIGLIIFLAYFFKNRKEKDGTVTVTNVTYIVGHEPEFLENEDILIKTHVNRVYDPPQSSSSSGGGGHHTSGGGGSHGGGGHSR